MTPLQRVLTSQGWPVGYADTLPQDVRAKLVACINVNSGELASGVRERVATIMHDYYESKKAVVDPPPAVDEPTEIEE